MLVTAPVFYAAAVIFSLQSTVFVIEYAWEKVRAGGAGSKIHL